MPKVVLTGIGYLNRKLGMTSSTTSRTPSFEEATVVD